MYISYCTAFYLSTFSHDAMPILASPESIAGGALNCETGQLESVSMGLFCLFVQELLNILEAA